MSAPTVPRTGESGGVYRGLRVVAGCFLGALVVFGVSCSYSVLLGPIQSDLALSRADVSLVFPVRTAVIYVAAAWIGVLADRYGVRRLLALGAVFFVAGTALASIGATTSVARVVVGWAADRVGRERTFVAGTAGLAGAALVSLVRREAT